MQNQLIFNTIPGNVNKNKFLPVDSNINKNFSGADSPDEFENNLMRMPADWYYRHALVNYTVNKQGYRAPEFNTVDWANSIVIFGCSNVFGTGVDDPYTIASQLSKLVNKPVINMGAGGSSITFSLHNNIILRSGYPMPFAVVNLWSEPSRTVYYHKRRITSYGIWNMEQGDYMDAWAAESSHGDTHAVIASKTGKILWENTNYFEASHFTNTASLLDCKLVPHLWPDRARDNVHPGILTNYNTAVFLAENLKL